MWGGYVWSLVALGVLIAGAVMAFATVKYGRSHTRRSRGEKRVSDAVTRENYRHPVK